jgi:methylthioribose-1-phosphate isomerase
VTAASNSLPPREKTGKFCLDRERRSPTATAGLRKGALLRVAVRLTPPDSTATNYAFDVTPARLVNHLHALERLAAPFGDQDSRIKELRAITERRTTRLM